MKTPLVFIDKWIDYSDKWGLGYRLSNGFYGVLFNDKTSIFEISKTPIGYSYIENKEITSYKSLEEFPEEIKKKKKLFLNFQDWLKGDKNESLKDEIPKDFVYLKQWKVNNNVFCFSLSTEKTSLIQVNLLSFVENRV